jgi:hypothetical protein
MDMELTAGFCIEFLFLGEQKRKDLSVLDVATETLRERGRETLIS